MRLERMQDRRTVGRLVLLAGLATGLAACGGGGGGGTVRPDPPAPPPPPPSTGLDFTPNVSNDASLTQVNPPTLPALGSPTALPQYSQHLQLINANVSLGAGLTGRGVTIGLVDSGVNRNHPALTGRVLRNFVNVNPNTNNTSVDDVVGHGTVVAQMAAGRGVGNWGGGVAQDANIVSSRIISDKPPEDDGSGQGNEITSGQGYGDFFREINAELAGAGARIINNSWGGLYWNDPALTVELAAAYRDFVIARGGIIVFANGNAGRTPELRPDPSHNAALPSRSPAAADLERGWLTVAALDPDKPTQLTDYSQACGVAMNYCLAAPGNVIFIDSDAKVGDAGYDLWRGGGTSYAAPQVAGAAAVVWSAFPYFDNDLVRQTLLGTARDLGQPGVDPEFGWGLLDVGKASMGPGNFAWGDVSVSFAGNSVWRNDIVGSGGLIKSGSGILTLAAPQSYTGDTRVQQGGLDFRYGLSSNLSIASGATVWARGMINGDVNNSGLFLNGAVNEASIVNDHRFVQTATGNLGVWLGSPLTIGGTASLDGQVSILGVKSGYVTGSRETLLTAHGGVSGTFSSVKGAPNVFLLASLAYDPTHAFLDITRIDVSKAVAAMGLPATVQASAVRVESAMAAIDLQLAGGLPQGIAGDFIDMAGSLQRAGSVAEASRSLRSLSGEVHAAAAAATFDTLDMGRRTLASHFDGLADGTGRDGAWMIGLGDAHRAGSGAGSQADGWMAGHDQRLPGGGVAGLAFGETRGHIHFNGLSDRSRERQVQAQAWLGRQWGKAYALGRFGAGDWQRQVDRDLLVGGSRHGVHSDYAGGFSLLGMEAGYRLAGALVPYLGFEYARVTSDGFLERGASGFGLRSDANVATRSQAIAGLRGGREWGRFGLEGHLEWQQTLASDGLQRSVGFVGAEAWSPLAATDPASPGGVFGVTARTRLTPRSALSFGYDRRFGPRGDASMASLRYAVGF